MLPYATVLIRAVVSKKFDFRERERRGRVEDN
jgi:hypothetical protein